MSNTVPEAEFQFSNSYAALPSAFFEAVAPTPVSEPRLFAFNDALAAELGLDAKLLNTETGANYFTGNVVPPGATPLAMAYAGHQFGHFVPQLGDGRAVLLGEVKNKQGHLQDVQLKGAGRTPFSRGGDGRAWIGPVMREYLISEAMHQLGVPTTRALAATTTGDQILRESGPLPGAVLTRVASSHLRVGTFEFFAAKQDLESLTTLVDFAIERHYLAEHQADNTDYPAALYLLDQVIAQQAALVAKWQSFGFIHGVMNTDNASIAGITIDYGPCAFMDTYSANKVFSSIDQRARYAYKNQPHIAQWNMASLAQTLVPLIHKNEEKAVEQAQESVDKFSSVFLREYIACFQRKLGIDASSAEASEQPQQQADLQLVNSLLELMETRKADFTLTFRELSNHDQHSEVQNAFTELFSNDASALGWFKRWQKRLDEASSSDTSKPHQQTNLMRLSNPAVIPRNHRVEEAINAAVGEQDFTPFENLHAALQNPFDASAQHSHYQQAPDAENTVTATFCGT